VVKREEDKDSALDEEGDPAIDNFKTLPMNSKHQLFNSLGPAP